MVFLSFHRCVDDGTTPLNELPETRSIRCNIQLRTKLGVPFTVGPTLWNPLDRFTRSHFVHRPSFNRRFTAASDPRPSATTQHYALTKGDIERLGRILRLYEGTHDFKAFAGQLEQKEKRDGKKIGTVRTVHRVELVKEPLKDDGDGGDEVVSPSQWEQLGFIGEEGNYRIDFLLQGALYKMVRNMVGTAIEVWLGRMSEEQLLELLHTDRKERATEENGNPPKKEKGASFVRKDNPCKPAPPEGLTLECVYYSDDDF